MKFPAFRLFPSSFWKMQLGRWSISQILFMFDDYFPIPDAKPLGSSSYFCISIASTCITSVFLTSCLSALTRSRHDQRINEQKKISSSEQELSGFVRTAPPEFQRLPVTVPVSYGFFSL